MGNGVAGACVSGSYVLRVGDPALHTSSWGVLPGRSEVLEVPEAGTARPANGKRLVCTPQLWAVLSPLPPPPPPLPSG